MCSRIVERERDEDGGSAEWCGARRGEKLGDTQIYHFEA